MHKNTIAVKPHKCIAKASAHTGRHFCSYCGIYMSKNSNGFKYHRSDKFNCIDPYHFDHDILLVEMVKKQSWNRYYNAKACHLNYRKDMIAFVEETAEKLEYRESTFHLAIALLDGLLSLYSIEKRMIKLISFMSIYIAAKLEENSEKIPDNICISKLFDNEYTFEEIGHCEAVFVKVLQYKLNLKTPYNFIEYFFSKGVLNDKDVKSIRSSKRNSRIMEFEGLATHFVRIALKDYNFYKYTSIAVATAAIACARKLMNLDQIWTDDLEDLTRVPFQSIIACSEILFEAAINTAPSLARHVKPQKMVEEICGVNKFSKLKSQSSLTTDECSDKEINIPAPLNYDDSEDLVDFRTEYCHNRPVERKNPFFLFSFNNFN